MASPSCASEFVAPASNVAGAQPHARVTQPESDRLRQCELSSTLGDWLGMQAQRDAYKSAWKRIDHRRPGRMAENGTFRGTTGKIAVGG